MIKQLMCSLAASGILLCPFSSLASDKQEKFLQKLEDVKNHITTRLRTTSTPPRPASKIPTSSSNKPTIASKTSTSSRIIRPASEFPTSSKPTFSSKVIVSSSPVSSLPKTSSSPSEREKKGYDKKSLPIKPLPPLPHFQNVSPNIKAKIKSTEDSCPEILTYDQLIKILKADFNTSRKSTNAIQIDDETYISVKARSHDSVKSWLQAIEKAGETVEAKFLGFDQTDYRGGTVAVQGEDNVIGFLTTYEVRKGGVPLKFGSNIKLNLSITKKKKY